MDSNLPNPVRQTTDRSSLSTRCTILYGVIAVFVRLIPFGVRPPNFAANGALGLFGGAKAPLYVIVSVQLLAWAISDYALYWLYGWKPFHVAVGVSFFIYAFLGRAFLRGQNSIARMTVITCLGSLQFFLITNFASWIRLSPFGSGPVLYEANLSGLLTCYAQGLIFLLFTLAGDFGCTAMMFGAEDWFRAKVERPVTQMSMREVAS